LNWTVTLIERRDRGAIRRSPPIDCGVPAIRGLGDRRRRPFGTLSRYYWYCSFPRLPAPLRFSPRTPTPELVLNPAGTQRRAGRGAVAEVSAAPAKRTP